MKKLILLVMLSFGALASTITQLDKQHLVGVKRKFTLYKVATKTKGTSLWIGGRIYQQGGTAADRPTLIFKNIFNKDKKERYEVIIGFETKGLPMPTGSLKPFKVKSAKAIEFDYSGPKKELFQEIFTFMSNYNQTNNELKLTGELRLEIESSTLYNMTTRVQYIVK